MLLKLFKALLMLVVVFAAVWIVVIGYWQATDRNPGGADLALYLLAFPIGLIVGYLALKKGIDRGRKRAAGRAAPANASAAGPATVTDEHNRQQGFTLGLVDAAIRLPIGADAQETLALLSEGSARPELDDQLMDNQNLPVVAARVPQLSIEDLALPRQYDETDLTWTQEQMRALSLAGDVLDQLTGGVLAQAMRGDESGNDTVSTVSTASSLQTTALTFALCLPMDWPQPIRLAAQAWLLKRIEAVEWQTPRIVTEVLTTEADTRPLAYIDQLSVDLNRQGIEGLCLLLACDSAIGETTVTRWGEDGTLFNPANSRGWIPAEGAAAVLLTTEAVAQRLWPGSWSHVHRVALDRHKKSANANGRITGELLCRLARQAILSAPCPTEDICCILADGGVQSGQVRERAELTTGDFSHLDSTSQFLSLGMACGKLGAVATVAALALGQARTVAENQPVMVLGMQHDFDRAALVLQPHAVEDASNPMQSMADMDTEQAII